MTSKELGLKLLLYCTKSKPYLYRPYEWDCFPYDEASRFYLSNDPLLKEDEKCDGKIVAECDYEIEEIKYNDIENYNYDEMLPLDKILEKSCLTKIDLEDYLNGNKGYAIHIKNLHIFDKPKELNEVYKIEDFGGMLFTNPLSNAPQNMMSVSVNQWEYGTYNPNDVNVLISIRPKWLCKILNGEKTIEVRKKVLKGMLENE